MARVNKNFSLALIQRAKRIHQLKDKSDYYMFFIKHYNKGRFKKLKLKEVNQYCLRYFEEYMQLKKELCLKYKYLRQYYDLEKQFRKEVAFLYSRKQLYFICYQKDTKRFPILRVFKKLKLLESIINKYIDLSLNKKRNKNNFIEECFVSEYLGYSKWWLHNMKISNPDKYKKYFNNCYSLEDYIKAYNKYYEEVICNRSKK